MKKLWLGIVMFGICFVGCKTEETDTLDCSGITPTYEASIKAIMDKNCIGCHNDNDSEAGFNFTSYAKLKEGAASHKLLGAINRKAGYEPMPQKADKLADSTIKIISCWIENGMPEK